MAKPAITKRVTKGSALTYAELDTNFQNLQDATIALTAGSGGTQVVSDLNGNITLVAGTGVTLSGDNTAKTITINSTSGSNSFTSIDPDNNDTVVADSNSDTLRLAGGTGITTSGNATTDTITITLEDDLTFQSVSNSSAGAAIVYPNGTILSSKYFRRRGNYYTNTSTPTVDLSIGRTTLPYDGNLELNVTVSSLAITLDTSTSASFEKICLLFKTTSGGGTFDITTGSSTVYWADGFKTCTRDGSTYILEIVHRSSSGSINGNVYYAKLFSYAV